MLQDLSFCSHLIIIVAISSILLSFVYLANGNANGSFFRSKQPTGYDPEDWDWDKELKVQPYSMVQIIGGITSQVQMTQKQLHQNQDLLSWLITPYEVWTLDRSRNA